MAGDADPDPDLSPTVTVTGDAVIRAEPDEALLWIGLSAPGRSRTSALRRLHPQPRAVCAAGRAGGRQGDRSTTGITVYEDFDHTKSGRRSLGHRATSRVSVRVADPDLIGRLIARATEELAARIDGPRWLISPGNSVHLEAARQAAADALRRAQAYAEGVGAKLGRVIRLAEADIGYVRRAASAPRAVAAAEPIAVEAGEHDVMASVEATFTLEID